MMINVLKENDEGNIPIMSPQERNEYIKKHCIKRDIDLTFTKEDFDKAFENILKQTRPQPGA